MNKKWFVTFLLSAFIAGFFIFDLGQYLNLDYFAQKKQLIEDYQAQHSIAVMVIYFFIYIAVTAFSLPGAVFMTLIGGALFGLGWGLLLVSFASSIGATLAFLIARTILHDWVQRRFGRNLQAVNRGIEKDGAFYLFTLRMVPLFPFFIVNLVMALTPVRAWTFYWVSQLGMLVGTVIFVNAGTQLANIENIKDILSPGLLGSFALLGVFPWAARVVIQLLKQRRVLSHFKKPTYFDTNLLVIGAGSAGLVSAYIAAAVNAKVTLVEKHKMGGDCLNTGCVPSKALIRSARINHYISRAKEFGIDGLDVPGGGGRINFSAVMGRVQQVVNAIEPHDSVERYSELGVNCVAGEATILSPWEVMVGKELISAKNIIIASGGRPLVPDIKGLEDIDYLTSDTLWDLQTLPKQLIVIGGGPIGCELAQAFSRLGSEVTLLIRSQLLPKEDIDVVNELKAQFQRDGIAVLENHKPVECEKKGIKKCIRVVCGEEEKEFLCDQLLVAAGRRANTEGLGLETIGIDITEHGTVAVDDYLRTDCPTIYACGDVAGPYQFTHVASHQAWYAAVNALFGGVKKFKVDYSVIPWVTFTDPEIARVGLSEREAREQGVKYEVTRYDIDELDRAIVDSEAHGFIKVLTVPDSDRILGVTIVGYHASELLAEYILAMKHGLGLNKILGTIHVYPTLNEANKSVAGVWKNAHKPEGLLKLATKFHRWRRGQ